MQRKAHYTGIASGKVADECLAAALDRIGAGLAHRFACRHVARDGRRGQVAEGHFRHIEDLGMASGRHQRDRTGHPMDAPRQALEHGRGVSRIDGLAEHRVIQDDLGIRSQHDGTRPVGDQPEPRLRLLTGDPAHVIQRCFSRLALLGNVQGQHVEAHPKTGQQLGAPGGLGGEKQHALRITRSAFLNGGLGRGLPTNPNRADGPFIPPAIPSRYRINKDTTMRTTRLRPLLIALAFALGGTAMTASAQAASSYTLPADGTLLSVSSQAEASRAPDIATISAGVVTQAPDGNTAMRQNATQMTQVMAAIRKAGIADKDIQTSGVMLNPQYDYRDNQAPKITGYQATNTVNLKVRDIAKLGQVLDALAAQGANQINGPTFEIDQPDPVYDEARLAALKKAETRAETYAKGLGLKVRRIVSIAEGSAGGSPRPVMMMARAKAADSTPVSPGETTLSVSIDVVFELGR